MSQEEGTTIKFTDITIKEGEVVVINDDDEVIAWIPSGFNDSDGKAIVQNGYMIITKTPETDDTPEILRNTFRVIRGGV